MSTKAMEIMFKSLGLGEAMAGVDRLIASGAIDKVVRFADDAEIIKQEIGAIRKEISEIRAIMRGPDNALFLARYAEFLRWAETQSGSDAADGGPANGIVL